MWLIVGSERRRHNLFVHLLDCYQCVRFVWLTVSASGTLPRIEQCSQSINGVSAMSQCCAAGLVSPWSRARAMGTASCWTSSWRCWAHTHCCCGLSTLLRLRQWNFFSQVLCRNESLPSIVRRSSCVRSTWTGWVSAVILSDSTRGSSLLVVGIVVRMFGEMQDKFSSHAIARAIVVCVQFSVLHRGGPTTVYP